MQAFCGYQETVLSYVAGLMILGPKAHYFCALISVAYLLFFDLR